MVTREEQKGILCVLRSLRRSGEEWRRSYEPSPAMASIDAAMSRFTAITETDLQRYILHTGLSGHFKSDEVIYIRPPAKVEPAASALWCRWDFAGDSAGCGFYLGTWWKTRTQTLGTGSCGGRIVFVGYRYETPEKGNNHNYFHVQPCRSMGGRDQKVPEALPATERNPTWPLAANTALDLLLCVFTSLYGMSGLAELEEEIQGTTEFRGNRLLLDSLIRLRKACGVRRGK